MGRRIGTGARSLTADGVVFDFYPQSVVRPPMILWPGGGWTTGGRSALIAIAEVFNRTHGWPVFIAQYLLAPFVAPNGPQTPIDQIKGFIRHVRDKASIYGVDGSLVSAGGLSAGAQLVFMAATTGATGSTRPDAAFGWSGPYRIRTLTSAALTAALSYLGVSQLAGNEALADLYSPYSRVDRNCCKIRMVHNDGEDEAEGEVAAQQTLDMEAAALAAGMAAGDVSKEIKVGTTHPVSDIAGTSAWCQSALGVSW